MKKTPEREVAPEVAPEGVSTAPTEAVPSTDAEASPKAPTRKRRFKGKAKAKPRIWYRKDRGGPKPLSPRKAAAQRLAREARRARHERLNAFTDRLRVAWAGSADEVRQLLLSTAGAPDWDFSQPPPDLLPGTADVLRRAAAYRQAHEWPLERIRQEWLDLATPLFKAHRRPLNDVVLVADPLVAYIAAVIAKKSVKKPEDHSVRWRVKNRRWKSLDLTPRAAPTWARPFVPATAARRHDRRLGDYLWNALRIRELLEAGVPTNSGRIYLTTCVEKPTPEATLGRPHMGDFYTKGGAFKAWGAPPAGAQLRRFGGAPHKNVRSAFQEAAEAQIQDFGLNEVQSSELRAVLDRFGEVLEKRGRKVWLGWLNKWEPGTIFQTAVLQKGALVPEGLPHYHPDDLRSLGLLHALCPQSYLGPEGIHIACAPLREVKALSTQERTSTDGDFILGLWGVDREGFAEMLTWTDYNGTQGVEAWQQLVPLPLVQGPLTADLALRIFRENSTEIRRVLLNHWGLAKVFDVLYAAGLLTLVDENPSRAIGTYYRLSVPRTQQEHWDQLRIAQDDHRRQFGRGFRDLWPARLELDLPALLEALPEDEQYGLLDVQCGTGRRFVLMVPPNCASALEANAWTYGLSPDDFDPEHRT